MPKGRPRNPHIPTLSEEPLPDAVAGVIDNRCKEIVRSCLGRGSMGDWEMAFRSCYYQGFIDGQKASERRNIPKPEEDLGAGI